MEQPGTPPGLVGQLRNNLNLTQLAQYTAELFESLEAETGPAHRVFGKMAPFPSRLTSNRFEELKTLGPPWRAPFGLEASVISPAEAKETLSDPAYGRSSRRGPLSTKTDKINPLDVVQAYAKRCKK